MVRNKKYTRHLESQTSFDGALEVSEGGCLLCGGLNGWRIQSSTKYNVCQVILNSITLIHPPLVVQTSLLRPHTACALSPTFLSYNAAQWQLLGLYVAIGLMI